jgi:hypothetical protein
MLNRKILVIALLTTSSLALAESTTTVTVGPSASVSVQSDGNSASASAGTVTIKQSGTGKVEVKNLQTIQSGNVSASAVVVNGGKEGNTNAQVEVTKEGEVKVTRTDKDGQVSTIVVGDDHNNIKVDSTPAGTTIEVK